ncbi:hypothetical protein B188_24930 [Candidatus Brocadiaceae bacterium B188]|nr:hypothetical protein [Candidatus Brocadia sapporoensis]MEB2307918.1 hypothetical protein [Candidatus Brocadiaceae bacterium]QQR65738.1 MAG: hypothetical protein IPI25_09200 [Candidatus Brocadia sp.]TWU50064.1 hypothetical protein B188_24930 [Candidatus Brocadiaceae bacterium B188]
MQLLKENEDIIARITQLLEIPRTVMMATSAFLPRAWSENKKIENL